MMAKGIYLIIHVSNLIIAWLLNLDLKKVDMNFIDIGIYNKNAKSSSSFIVLMDFLYTLIVYYFSLYQHSKNRE